MSGYKRPVCNVVKDYIRGYILTRNCAPKMMVLAIEMGMSERTLRRKLTLEGSSYRQLKRQVRRQLLAGCEACSMDDRAVRAGFSETRSLRRLYT